MDLPQRSAREVRAAEWNSYPLSLMAVPDDGLRLALSYDRNRFDAATITRMLAHLQCVLEQMAGEADHQLADQAQRQGHVLSPDAITAAFTGDASTSRCTVGYDSAIAASISATTDARVAGLPSSAFTMA